MKSFVRFDPWAFLKTGKNFSSSSNFSGHGVPEYEIRKGPIEPLQTRSGAAKPESTPAKAANPAKVHEARGPEWLQEALHLARTWAEKCFLCRWTLEAMRDGRLQDAQSMHDGQPLFTVAAQRVHLELEYGSRDPEPLDLLPVLSPAAARFFPLIGKTVRTPRGPGLLEQVLTDRVAVALDAAPERLAFFKPAEVRP